jgi:two-component system, OmpR family, KDP operon response regulator KdpE
MKIKPRILIVDDEPQIARVLKISLAARGYNIQVASDGISALEIFGNWQPDLVITDLSMPRMDGLKLCRKLRVASRIPIIVISAESKKHIKFEALDAGADDYLTKPFDINELLNRIGTLLSANKENEPIGT